MFRENPRHGRRTDGPGATINVPPYGGPHTDSLQKKYSFIIKIIIKSSSSSSVYLFNKTVQNTVTNVGTNEVETRMTRLIALTVTPVY